MSSREPMPSLADLRRKSRPKMEVRPEMPGLFDLLPATDELAAEPHNLPIVELNVQQLPTSDPGIDEQLESTKLRQQVPDPRVWTVGELVQQVRGVLERSYAQIIVEGEISNWRPAATGHCYFTLKDGAAQLSVVMFRRQASLVRFQPKDGDAVRLRGQLSVFESRGQMQLIAEWMEPRGLGALLAAVRELKERLRREGLFDHKRPLPSFPRCIGVVTSEHGAALRDIVKVCRRRHAAVNLLIYPAAVQGPRCAIEVAAGVRWFSRNPDRADVVLVARGGGSWEDLHGFDDERVARAIAACSVPVIVGVGHATDSTIADAAADVSAPTPSAAAEIVTAAHHRIEERVDRLHSRLIRAGRYEVLRARQSLSHLGAEAVLRRVRDALDRRAQRCDELDLRLHNVLSRRIRTAGDHSFRLETRLLRQDPAARLRDNGRELENLRGRLSAISLAIASHRATQLDRAVSKLQALSPVHVLERGYALVYGPTGKLLRASTEIQPGEQITARLHRGSLGATVTEKK
jgi:exodeoxyribonuclease VII large subunit